MAACPSWAVQAHLLYPHWTLTWPATDGPHSPPNPQDPPWTAVGPTSVPPAGLCS